MGNPAVRKTDEEIWNMLHDIIRGFEFFETLPEKDQNLVEFGFDDLDEVEFLMDLETAFNIKVEETAACKLKTLNDYFTYLRNHGI